MNPKITFLGTGTSTGIPMIGCECAVCISDDPRDKRLRTSCLITIDDKNILIDIGPDFRQQALAHKITKLDAILLTHPHRDHIAGFDEIRALNFIDNRPIPLYANQFTWHELQQQFHYVFQETDYKSLPKATYHQVENQPFVFENIEIIPLNVLHGNMVCIGYRIGNMAYITDVNYIPETEFDKLKNLDLLVLDSLRIEKHPSHFSLAESIATAQRINAKKTYFTHISHNMGKHAEVSKTLPENIFFAYDGYVVPFVFVR